MRLGIMQPYFMPYLGYFQLMALVDKYVIFDDVNYIRRGWSARNNILVNGQNHLFSIAVEGGSQNKLYTEVMVSDNFVKFRKTLQMCYKKAPCFKDTMEILERVFSFNDKRFNYFMKNSYEILLDYFGIDTELILSSSLKNDKNLKGKDKIMDICKLLNTDWYINAIGGRDLYDEQEFGNNGIRLSFLEPKLNEYPQLSLRFVPALSIIDVMMMNNKDELRRQLNSYQLL